MRKIVETKTEEVADVVGRNIPCLDPRDQNMNRTTYAVCRLNTSSGDDRQYWQSAGGAWRTAFIIAPADMVPADLHSYPKEVWWKLQQQPMLKLSFLDEVVVVDAAGTWMVEGRVLAADDNSVTFKPSSTTKLPQQPVVPVRPTHTSEKVAQTMVM